MVTKCILCDALIGCEKGKIKMECEGCRLADGCSLQHYFTTTNVSFGLCRSCRKGLWSQEGLSEGETLHITH